MKQADHYKASHCAALDCIFIEKEKTFYVIDLLAWEDFIYSDYPLCSRLLFLQQKLANIPDLNNED